MKINIFNFNWLITKLNKNWFKHFITWEQLWEDFLEYWKPFYINFEEKEYWKWDIVHSKDFNIKEKEIDFLLDNYEIWKPINNN